MKRQPLFKLIPNPDRKGELMGYPWIEIYSVHPREIETENGKHCILQALCVVPKGTDTLEMMSICLDDLQNEYEEYLVEK